ncbi:DUF481 domain-containing protein [Seongchinamella sediminis]|uniref:DUF481 domain-containing protein n=1 Tax=Seongchinamella sediminis TaxID=2283635 RepID=A0A3L7E1Q1_9GAMM|nr:DUF481 domain-containing protein [Seongchinamella sediminis]RLQ22815.1 DUF481 domain-containing protein [Seongchinamella sediminis]
MHIPRLPTVPFLTTHGFLPALGLLLAVLSHDALASRKTDVVTLYNGDRITGEIKSMDGGILKLSTDAMGTLSIEWPEVAGVTSDYHYELRLSDGKRLYGSFGGEGRPGQVELVDLFGRHDIEWLQVVEIRPIEDELMDRLDVYLATTFAYTKATSVAQLSFNTEVSYEDQSSRTSLNGRTDLTTSDSGDSNSSRYDVERWSWREQRSDAFTTIFANYENNDELGLNRRVGVGAGVGKYWKDTHSTRFTGALGLQAISESFTGEKTNEDVELYLSTTFSTWNFNHPELDIDFSFSVIPSLTERGRLRTDGNLRIRWELIDDLYWDISTWVTTDNQTSDEGASTDYAITTGVGWTL